MEVVDDVAARSLYRFRKVCCGLERIAFEHDLSVYFMTFTLAGDSVDCLNSSLDSVLHFLRRKFKKAGEHLYYAWVAELQKKRYEKYGVLALHWHFVVLARHGALPDVRFNARAARGHKYEIVCDGSLVSARELYERWGKGQVLCGCAWSGVRNYLEKYMVKEYESFRGYKPEWARLRRFGASQMGYHAFPRWAYGELRSLSDLGVPLEDLWVQRVPGAVSVSCEVVREDWSLPQFAWVEPEKLLAMGRNERLVLYRFESPWVLVHDKPGHKDLSLGYTDSS
jgi:hypothetical protein